MAGESQLPPESQPDPTVYVQAAIDRAARANRELILAELAIRDQRLDGIDEATKILSETINRTPTVIQTEIGHVRELMVASDKLTDQRFIDRDAATHKQDETNKEALGKAEQLITKVTDALDRRLGLVETGITRLNAERRTAGEQRTESRASMGSIYAFIGAAAVLITLVVVIANYIAANSGG